MDMSLNYFHFSKSELVGYANVGYLSDPCSGRPTNGLCLHIWWDCYILASTKRTISAISSNHAKILAIHEVS